MEREFTIYDSSRIIEMNKIIDYCNANEIAVPQEDSNEYWDICHYIYNWEWEDLERQFEHNKNFDNDNFMVTGELGLWTGKHTIIPKLFDSLWDALSSTINGMDDVKITFNNGKIKVFAYHHDGTNVLEINRLSAKGIKEVNRKKYVWNGDDYDVKSYWFKQIKINELW